MNTPTCSNDIPAGLSLEEIRQSAWIGDAFIVGPVRTVIVTFHGLGFSGLKNGPAYDECEWAAAGALVIFPYYGPWSWMNRSARRFVDMLIPSVYQRFNVPGEVPLVIVGGSMGGQGSLIYTRYSPHHISGCLADFPVCDLAYHFTERPELPPTMRYAFRDESNFAVALDEQSPLKQSGSMPDIQYLLIHGDKDIAVNKERHSDRFAAEMRLHNRNLEYVEVPGMGHNSNIPFHVSRRRIEWVKGFFQIT
jgi:dipeptidyl aminopeptidase/acylaminoacyl peptidase